MLLMATNVRAAKAKRISIRFAAGQWSKTAAHGTVPFAGNAETGANGIVTTAIAAPTGSVCLVKIVKEKVDTVGRRLHRGRRGFWVSRVGE